MAQKELKEQLRAKVADFAISGHLINISSRKSDEKEQQVEEMYLKLEKWIFENFYPSSTKLVPISDRIPSGYSELIKGQSDINMDF